MNEADFQAQLAKGIATLDLVMGDQTVTVQLPADRVARLFDPETGHSARFDLMGNFVAPGFTELCDARFPDMIDAAIAGVTARLEARKAPVPTSAVTVAPIATTEAPVTVMVPEWPTSTDSPTPEQTVPPGETLPPATDAPA